MVKIIGAVSIRLRDAKTGQIKYARDGKNLVVNAGAIELAKIVTSTATGTRPTHLGVGTSTTAPSAGQTDLQAASLRNALSFTSRTNNAIRYGATFATGEATGDIEEAGLFNASSAGTMFSRFLTGTFSKAATDELDVTWTLTFGTG